VTTEMQEHFTEEEPATQLCCCMLSARIYFLITILSSLITCSLVILPTSKMLESAGKH
jgi:hypothetical protein